MFLRRSVLTAAGPPALALCLSVAYAAEPTPEVPAREALTYRNMGIYSGWQPYFLEGPFDFLLVQGAVIWGKDEAADLEAVRRWNEHLVKARTKGKRVIADVLWRHRTAETQFQTIERFLDGVDVAELYAITIGEENIFWDGYHELLTDFYHRIKQKYPDLPVYQWYSNTFRGTDWPGFTWPWLPADGWVVDEYWAEPRDFEQAVRRHRMLGLPLIQLAWATPMMPRIPFHQAVLEGQLRVARKYNVPCAFFCYDETNRVWAWHEDAREPAKKVFGFVLDAMEQAKQVADADLTNWDLCKPLETVLEEAPDGQFVYRESYDLRMKAVGYKLPKHDFMKRSLVRGLRHLRWVPDPSRLIVRSHGREPVDVSLTNHWRTPNGEQCRFSASARITVEPGAPVGVIFEVSSSGYDWVARATEAEDGIIRVDGPAVHGHVYTRLRIAGRSEDAGAPLATIDWIEVRGRVTE